MTKVTILGQEPEQKKLKPIEFIRTVELDGEAPVSIATKPKNCIEIYLLAKNYSSDGLDLFFINGFISNEDGKYLYLGHFNDGVVE